VALSKLLSEIASGGIASAARPLSQARVIDYRNFDLLRVFLKAVRDI
jgi:hypothetical protein